MRRAKTATVNLKTRMKEPLRAKIEAAAKARGVSLNAELVSRIEASFVREDAERDALGGKEMHATLRMFAAAANLIEARTGKPWLSDWDTAIAVKAAWQKLVIAVMPPPPEGLVEFMNEETPESPTPIDPPPSIADFFPQGLLAPPPSEDQRESFDQAVADYEGRRIKSERETKKYATALERRSRQLDERIQHMEAMAGFGKEIAGGLLPERPEGKE